MSGDLMTNKYIREEEDGTITTTYATNCGGIMKTHNSKGPAIVNKKQKIGDYYLYGVKHTKDEWASRIKKQAY
jgi:hypothetical protein|tara:strand:+ start:1921 stop:2139 length:219 start_codon:yes stop_codon:yes gene_type:complete